MVTIYLALGSNVGDKHRHIAGAVERLRESLNDVVAASLYRSKAVGYTEQDDFLNTAIKAQTSLSPAELLVLVKQIEQSVGRTERFRWGPREIDIDIIFYGDMVMTQPDLTVPHPSFSKRDFVLKPICDIDPNFVDPISKKTVKMLLDAIPDKERSIVADR
jgi:2-amino-4-hydroxy-6-hydroxymethyldihydropteridine diphosphokinase